MKDHYDFSKMKGRRNPYIKYWEQPVTIRPNRDAVAYFKSKAFPSGKDRNTKRKPDRLSTPAMPDSR